jgi:hypothetical protein
LIQKLQAAGMEFLAVSQEIASIFKISPTNQVQQPLLISSGSRGPITHTTYDSGSKRYNYNIKILQDNRRPRDTILPAKEDPAGGFRKFDKGFTVKSFKVDENSDKTSTKYNSLKRASAQPRLRATNVEPSLLKIVNKSDDPLHIQFAPERRSPTPSPAVPVNQTARSHQLAKKIERRKALVFDAPEEEDILKPYNPFLKLDKEDIKFIKEISQNFEERKCRQHFDTSFKVKACKIAKKHGINFAAEYLKIQKQNIRRWKLELFPETSHTKTSKGRKPKNQQKEKQLRKEVLIHHKTGQFTGMSESNIIKIVQKLASGHGLTASRIWVKAFCRRSSIKLWTLNQPY